MIDHNLDNYIMHLVNNNEVHEQSELQEILKAKGYDVPQATLSRKLKKLNIAKVAGVYKIIEFNQPNLPLIVHAQTTDFGTIVLHTTPGNASNLAYYIDQKYISRNNKDSIFLASIAGDDTVLLIFKNQQNQRQAIELLMQDFPYLDYK